jgi:hypothetical protein
MKHRHQSYLKKTMKTCNEMKNGEENEAWRHRRRRKQLKIRRKLRKQHRGIAHISVINNRGGMAKAMAWHQQWRASAIRQRKLA